MLFFKIVEGILALASAHLFVQMSSGRRDLLEQDLGRLLPETSQTKGQACWVQGQRDKETPAAVALTA